MDVPVNDSADSQLSIQNEIEQAMRQAVTQHQAGNFQLAEQLYLAILQVHPHHPDANHNLGVLAVQTHQPALPHFLAALNADPARAEFWLSYIEALIEANQSEEAAQILTLARQQGLEGEQVEALTRRLQPRATAQTVTAAKSKTKKTTQNGKKHPDTQEMNALSNMFNKGCFAEAVSPARKMTERYPSHGLGWKALGIALIQTGNIHEALIPLQTAARLLPKDIGVFNYLGNILNETGQLGEAELNYRRILQIEPNHAEANSNLGNNLRNQGRLAEAEACYRRALKFKPDYAVAHNNLGNTLWEQGRLNEAEASFRRAIQIAPDFAAAHCNLGNNLRSQRKLTEAEACYRHAIRLVPAFVEAHNNLAITLKELGRLDEALASCRQAVAIKPDYAEAHSNLGGALRELGRLDEAVLSFRRALELKPEFAEAASNLGGILRQLGHLDEAMTHCLKALQIQPDYAEAYCNLAGVQKELGLLDEAADSCGLALQLKPDYAEAHSNLGTVLQAQSKFELANESYLNTLRLKPDFTAARMNLGFSQLSCGQLSEGWKNHEFRVALDRKRFARHPSWAGESLTGKAILIWGEQGVGDEIIFASLYAEVIAQAARCVIECAPKLLPLFTRSFPAATVVAKTEPPHPATMDDLDCQCAAGSLAQWQRPNLASFPLTNTFLTPDPARVAHWQQRLAELGPGPKIGFSWRSSLSTGERALSCTTLAQWEPIFRTPGVHFINLQYDECSAELAEATEKFGIPLHAFTEVDMYNDLDETAALARALDLVITAPTSIYALTAGLGVNTWVMTYGVPWLAHGTDHFPWFPSLRYFSRSWDQTWETVIGTIATQLPSPEWKSQPVNAN